MAIEVPFEDLSPRTCAVLGGQGFLGRSLVFRLLKLGNWIVRVADSAPSLKLDLTDSSESFLDDAISSGRASYHPLDVLDVFVIVKAIEGSSVVFYIGANELWNHDVYHCYKTMVQGTKNVISACRECKVGKLIYNSSADVVFDGSHNIFNGDESLRCHWKFEDTLNDLKAHAEALVLFANNIDGILTCALRPSNVFGPGDTACAIADELSKIWFCKGSGETMSEFMYAENVTHAHICAAEALDSHMLSVAGKAFFITNLELVKFWEFVSLLLEGFGFQRPLITLPARMVCAAQKYIGYSPVVPLDDGIALTIESFSNMVKDPSFMRYANFQENSKVDKLLGGGKVADILLWRDEKKTFKYFLAFAILFYWFLLSGRTFTSSAAKFLLLITTILYEYGILPSKISGFTIQRISLSWFEISNSVVKDSITSIAYLWNSGFHKIRSLGQGQDWSGFFKVVVFIYLTKLILLQSWTVVVGVALVFAYTAFFVYEQYESEIDGLEKILLNRIM